MAFSAKLCNPTPWDAVIHWDRGVRIRIPAFGETQLTMQQMDDFRGDKPGSEEAQNTLDAIGVFLFDADRPYDNQAVIALERMHRAKKSQFDDAHRNLLSSRSAQGIAPNDEAMEETLKQMGLATLRDKIKLLEEQAKRYREQIGPETRIREKLDPTRTVFVLDPPRQFPSATAMMFFLEQNDDVRIQHEAFNARRDAAAQEQENTVAASEALRG